MALFVIERGTDLAPAEAWRRLTAWERHAQSVPLTRIEVLTAPPTRVGTAFVARTGVGRVGFADPMRVAEWEPPVADDGYGRCRLEKTGQVVLGWAEISVEPAEPEEPSDSRAGGGCRVRWREELRVRGLPPAVLDPVLAPAGRLVFGRTVDALLHA